MRSRVLQFALGVLAALALEAHAGSPALLPGTSWSGSANLAAKISAPGQGSDTTRGATTFVVAFGPLAAPALASNEFRLMLDDGSAEIEIDAGGPVVRVKLRISGAGITRD